MHFVNTFCLCQGAMFCWEMGKGTVVVVVVV